MYSMHDFLEVIARPVGCVDLQNPVHVDGTPFLLQHFIESSVAGRYNSIKLSMRLHYTHKRSLSISSEIIIELNYPEAG